jgi:Trypsin
VRSPFRHFYKVSCIPLTHCLADSFNGSSKVLVGPYLRDSTEGPAQYRDRDGALQVHPEYNKTTIKYDFMLFKIQPVTLSNLKPITLNVDADNPEADQALTVIGMGLSDENTTSNVLEGVQLSAVSHEQCQQEWSTSGGQDIDVTSMVCASTTNGKDVCGGM